jgi:hypothetical protein
LTAGPPILSHPWVQVGLLSALLCLANVGKPLVVDDAAYYAYAAHIAEHPLDPYGFTIFWYQQPQPATEVLAPPVFCYWWALGIRLFGDSPVLWKLWLWPWCVLFAAAVVDLCRWFARSVAVPTAWLIVGSPTVLPALNLMLDIPALALSMAAIALFQRVRLTNTTGGALTVGLLTAAAVETKYTALVTPAVLVVAAGALPVGRRARAFRQALVALIVAVAIVCSWELWVAGRYGASHFVLHATRAGVPWARKGHLFWPLIGILGGVGAPLVVLGLTALRAPRFCVRFTISLMAACWLLYRLWPGGTVVTFGWIGVLTLAAIGCVAMRSRDRRSRFLAAWWLLALAGYFLLSPWPAVRRVIGLCVVGTLVLARRIGPMPDFDTRRRVIFAAAWSVGFGVVFQVVDIADAVAERTAVEDTARLLHRQVPDADVRYTGHLGMQFYADRAGWRPVVPGESRLPAGSWLVIPDRPYGRQAIELPDAAREVFAVEVATPWLLHTIPAYYGGSKAIERSSQKTMLRVYRLAADCTPRAPADSRDDSESWRH